MLNVTAQINDDDGFLGLFIVILPENIRTIINYFKNVCLIIYKLSCCLTTILNGT